MSWLQAPPTKPAGQVQMARPLRGLVSHTAPSLQGLLTHASSRWHSKPVEKAQEYTSQLSTIAANTTSTTEANRQTYIPVFPTGHSQKNDATRSWQVAPLKQTAIAQSSMFSLQSSPVQPLTQTQVWPPIVLKQVPPLWQAFGCMRHSLTSSAQYCPKVVHILNITQTQSFF